MRRFLHLVTLILAFGGWCTQADAAWREKTGAPITKASDLTKVEYVSFEARCCEAATGKRWSAPNTYRVFDGYRASHVFRVVVLPEANPVTGEPQIQLQSVETGKWFNGGDGYAADTQEEAVTLTVGQASKYTVIAAKGEGWTEDNPVWSDAAKAQAWDFKTGGTDALTLAGNVTSTDPDEWPFIGQVWGWDSYSYFWYSQARDVNALYAYEMEEYDDFVQDLADLLADYEAAGYAEMFVPGTAVGYYGEAEVAAFNAAIEKAGDLLVDPATSDEQLKEAIANLKKALEDVQASMVGMHDGYFYIMSAYQAYFNQQKVHKAMYDDGSKPMWKTFVEKKPEFLFKFTQQEDGSFAIQNIKTGRYINGVGTTGETSTQTQTLVLLGGGEYNIRDASGTYHTNGHSSGAGTGNNIVSWSGGRNTASSWSFTELTDQTLIDSIVQAGVQEQLNAAFSSALATAREDSAAGYPTKFYIKRADQLSSNATESSEGSLANLIDGEYSTYFHTSWSKYIGETHYLQVALDEPMQNIALYWKKRHNNNANRPTHITILASNDGTTFNEVKVIPEAPDTFPTNASQIEYRSKKAIDLGAPYKYLRFRVDSTNTGALEPAKDGDAEAPRYPFFTFSEFNISDEGFPVDPEGMAMREDMKDAYAALKAAIDVALAVDPTKATQADIDAIKAATEAFNKVYPDTTLLANAISQTETYASQALVVVEGQEASMGMCTEQSTVDGMAAAAKAARAALDANAKMTRAEIDAEVAKLEAANEAFFATVVMPEPNKWYFMESKCTGREDGTLGSIVYPDSKAIGAQIKWGNSIANGGTMDVKYLWRFVPVAGKEDVYAVQNMGTGYYLGEDRGRSTAFLLSDTIVEFKIGYVAGGELTLLANKEGANMAHAQADGKVLVPWTSGMGSASAWTFVAANADDQVMEAVLFNNSGDIFCLPYDITGDFYGYNFEAGIEEAEVTAYTITDARYDENGDITEIGVTTKEIGEEGIPAGTPFILIAGDINAEDGAGDTLHIDLGLIFDSEISTEAKEDNGMIGLMSTTTVEPAGIGYFSLENGLVTSKNGNTSIVGQTGYIDGHKVKTSGEAELYIPVKDGVITEIKQAVKDSKAIVNVYTVDGKLVRKNVKNADALKGLQKGLYVVNGKVYSVK